MEQEKDYSLLRPFDLKAAKEGAAIDDTFGGRVVFVDGPDAGGKYAVRIDGHFAAVLGENLRMAPLCWVEGRPVYKGDVLYCGDKRVVAEGTIPQFNRITEPGGGFKSGNTCFSADCLTWTPPKVKREGWVNIYPCIDSDRLGAKSSRAYNNVEDANAEAGINRIACIRIEWEE